MSDKQEASSQQDQEQKDKQAADANQNKQEEKEEEEDEYGWDDITQMTPEQVKEELVEQRKRFEAMERDLFKAQTAARKLSA